MSKVALICLSMLALGLLLGFLTAGWFGSITGLILAGILAIPIFCITEVLKRNAAQVNVWEDPLSDMPSRSYNDASRLPKAAYEPSNKMG